MRTGIRGKDKTCKYAVNTNGLKTLRIPQIIDLAADVKLDGIEWGLPALDSAKSVIGEMARATQDRGLEVVGYINGGKMWKRDEITRWAELVASVQGRSLRVAHPWIAWNYDESLHQGRAYPEIFKLARDSMPYLMELGKTYGIRFVMELHSGALTASALAAANVMQGFDPQYIGVIYDPANTIIEGNMRPRSEVEVLGDYLAYVHAKNVMCAFTGQFTERPVPRAKWEFKVCHLPYGIVDWLEVFYALKLASYRGWISCEEFFKPDESCAEELKDGIAFLKACEKHAPSAPQAPFTDFND
ncbi:MAG: sugar phosphate isomerase/epimerase [Verrucomicrobia bacterium]|nr:sugar phosphate isomerase/epimerase [Verrucomicrobiota bacterium]MBU1733715.1 sugar phosphate isomerase/epimerase [Verrucomicrobiota bacterium]MBU1855895.1 sugar phosphate isomerase/epimerase [Verrucomicrobiota bacterium]